MTTVRRALLYLLCLGMLGAGTELLLLEHYEDPWQLAPLIVLGLGLIVLVWCAATRSRASVRLLQAVMVVFMVTGIVGLWMHYSGNAEFELEMVPTRTGLSLVWESLRGATPAVAPATMLYLGLLGLVYTVRHPSLAPTSSEESS